MKSIKNEIRGMFGRAKTRCVVSALSLLSATPAFASAPNASGSSMPWESPLNMILESLQGPVARFAIIAAIVVTGGMMAFGEHGQGFKKVLGIVFGGAIVVGAVSFATTLFGAHF